MATRSIDSLARAASPWACAIGGGLVGLLGGPRGLGAGVHLGAMLDIARLEARSRRRIVAFLQNPRPPFVDRAGGAYAAAFCLALRGEWPVDPQVRRALWSRFSMEALPASAARPSGPST